MMVDNAIASHPWMTGSETRRHRAGVERSRSRAVGAAIVATDSDPPSAGGGSDGTSSAGSAGWAAALEWVGGRHVKRGLTQAL
jgi:hypothetical protein